MEEESQVPPAFSEQNESATREAPPGLSRKVLFGTLAAMVVAFTAGSVYLGYQVVTTTQVDKLGKAVAGQGGPKAATPAAPAATPVTAAPAAGALEMPPATADAGMGAGPSAPPTLPSAAELLAGATKPARPAAPPAALVRDLPEWLAKEVGGPPTPRAPMAPPVVMASSGASADESSEQQRDQGKEQGRDRNKEKAPARMAPERASAVFARCPKPGESGAVECRRAVCSGAARKQAACSAYL